MEIKIKLLSDYAKIPTRGSEYAAGYDLYACLEGDSCVVEPHSTVKISTGVAIQPPKGTFGAIVARSGLATKQGLAPANKLGVCDEDYTGEYIVALHNHSNEARTVEHGDRIAQLVFIPYVTGEFVEVLDLDETDRGEGGFGSTGTN